MDAEQIAKAAEVIAQSIAEGYARAARDEGEDELVAAFAEIHVAAWRQFAAEVRVLGESDRVTPTVAATVPGEAHDATGIQETGPAGDSGEVGGDRDGARGDGVPRGDGVLAPAGPRVLSDRPIQIWDTVVRAHEYGRSTAEQGVVTRLDSSGQPEAYVQWRGESADIWLPTYSLVRIA
jgi:hypothetical protein